MELIPITPKYYEFVREMRNHPENRTGFIKQVEITEDKQVEYMSKHYKNYYVCLLYGKPVGYVGVIDNDIRICTHPEEKGMGVGKFMLDKIIDIFPNATGKIKQNNIPSQKLFDKCKVPYITI